MDKTKWRYRSYDVEARTFCSSFNIAGYAPRQSMITFDFVSRPAEVSVNAIHVSGLQQMLSEAQWSSDNLQGICPCPVSQFFVFDWTCTDEMKRSDISTSILIGFPSSSTGGAILKTCRTVAMLRNSEASAKYLPGHILVRASVRHLVRSHESAPESDLLPEPNMNANGSTTVGSSFPSRMKRSGWNS